MTRKSLTRDSSLRGAAQHPKAILDDQLFELHGDTEVFTVVTAELVLVGILEPFARHFVVDEKSEYDGSCAASGPLHDARRRTVPWRR